MLAILVRGRSGFGKPHAPAVEAAKGRGRYAHLALEGFGEVALIGEAGIQGNLDEWRFRGSEALAGEFDAKSADVFPYGAAMKSPKRTGQMISRNPDRGRQLAE